MPPAGVEAAPDARGHPPDATRTRVGTHRTPPTGAETAPDARAHPPDATRTWAHTPPMGAEEAPDAREHPPDSTHKRSVGDDCVEINIPTLWGRGRPGCTRETFRRRPLCGN